MMIIRRRSAILLPVALALLLAPAPASPQDFEAEYGTLVDEFAGSLANASAAEALLDRADALRDRIRQHRRDNRADLSREELDRLSDLAEEVLRFGAVTRVVGQVHNAADASIEGFDAVKSRLGLEPRVIQTFGSGLELVRIEVGTFVSLLLRNPTKTTFTITYGVNDPERPGGVGSAACERYSVMSGLFNSRDRDIDGLEFTVEARPAPVGNCD